MLRVLASGGFAAALPEIDGAELGQRVLPMLDRLAAQFEGAPWVGLAVGVALLLLGRKLFWLALTVLGLLAGFAFAQRFGPQGELWITVAVGLVAGLVAVALALFVQKLAVGLAAFVVGGYASLWVAAHLGYVVVSGPWASDPLPWMVFLVGGAVAALFGQFFFKLALIVVTAICGAFLVVQALPIESRWTLPALGLLTLVGIAAQSRNRS